MTAGALLLLVSAAAAQAVPPGPSTPAGAGPGSARAREAADHHGTVAAGREPETVLPDWTIPLEGPPSGAILVLPRVWVVPLKPRGLQVVDLPSGPGAASSGTRHLDTGDFVAGPILAGTDVVWAEAEHVIARDPESGSPRWRSPARGSRDLLATPTSIIVREPDAVRALGAGDGRELWSVPAGAEGGPLSLASGMLMVPDAGKMRALDPGCGREWFRVPIGGKGGAVPRSTGVSSRQGTLFWGADDGTVTALDFRGTELRGPGRRWRLHKGGPIAVAPVPILSSLLVLSIDNEIGLYDAGDGFRIWRASTPFRPLGGPTVLGRRVFLAAGVGGREILALQLEDGRVSVRYGFPEPDEFLQAPPSFDAYRNALLAASGPYGFRLHVFGDPVQDPGPPRSGSGAGR